MNTRELLKPAPNCDNVEMQEQQSNIDWAEVERALIPLLNKVRRAQGKKPVIVPKG